jgi:peptide chain release factor subunit 1
MATEIAVDLPVTLRRLAATRTAEPTVLSLYVNLDPSEVPTLPDRATAIRAVIDEAGRAIEARRGELSHQAMRGLREDLAALRERLESSPRVELGGGKALALFRSSAIDLDESVPLPRTVRSRVVIDTAAFLEPLLATADHRRWCVALVNRRVARFLHGTRDRLEELTRRRDDVHGQHDQGGWSQPNYERSVEAEVAAHLQGSAEALRQVLAAAPFDHLVIGGPHELHNPMTSRLHAELRERLVDCVEVDVENSTPSHVAEAIDPVVERYERDEERRILDRLIGAVASGGRGAAGLADTLTTLNERRVEVLAFEDGFSAAGRLCPRDGWLGPEDAVECPVDGTPTEARPNIVDDGVLAALGQAADVLVVRYHADLGPHGRIGAILRF